MTRVYSIGDRILNSDKRCFGTVRWIGKLNVEQIKIILEKSVNNPPFRGHFQENLEDDTEMAEAEIDSIDPGENYLGIEWDDDLQGFCNGEIGEDKLFDPIYSMLRNHYRKMYSEPRPAKLLSCSFLTPYSVYTEEKTFAQAVFERYVDDFNDDNEDHSNSIEFVGREQAVNYFRDLNNLRIISVNKYNISSIGKLDYISLPKLNCIQLIDNLFSCWTEISKIAKFSPKLSNLDMSGNKMSLFTFKPEECEIFSSLKILYLNRSFVQFNEFATLCGYGMFPKLEVIQMCNNYISTLIIDNYDNLPDLKVINLSDNYISDIEGVFKLIHNVASLKKLLISGNKLSTIGNVKRLEKYQVEHLEELYIENNLINDWDMIVYFSKRFINLKCLRINGNNLKSTTENLKNECRNILVSLFPKLENLEGSNISNIDRTNAERYFISMANSGNNSYTMVQNLDPNILDRLEQIHGKRECVDGDSFLKKNFVELILVPDGELCDFSKGITKRSFPNDAKVKDLKIVCSKLFGVQYSMVKLTYNDGKMPISLELDDDFARIDQHGIWNGYIIRVQHPIQL